MSTLDPRIPIVTDDRVDGSCDACGAEPTPRGPVLHVHIVDADGAIFSRLCKACVAALTAHLER